MTNGKYSISGKNYTIKLQHTHAHTHAHTYTHTHIHTHSHNEAIVAIATTEGSVVLRYF